MGEKQTSVFENGLIWFGAAVSLAEILTGTYFAPLGLQRGLLAIFLGHIIGCSMLFAAGLIGGRVRKSSMEAVKMSFGQRGSLLFAVLNILQLVGWTAIMIYDGALAAGGVWNAGHWVWCLVVGGLVVVWILVGVENLGRLNTVAMAALLVLTVVLSFRIFQSGGSAAAGEAMTFGAAVELSVAMPLSWLPLISDYTREAAQPVRATAVSVLVYGLVSCWMYGIGMGAAIFAGDTDIAQIILHVGLGAAGLLGVGRSTVTTAFLAAYAAGVSGETVYPGLRGKWMAVAAAVIGTAGAVFFPMDNITEFLYLIGSVFAPMIAIQIADFFLLRRDHSGQTVDLWNLGIWAVGFVVYRLLMRVDIVAGSTLPDMMVTIVLCLIADRFRRGSIPAPAAEE